MRKADDFLNDAQREIAACKCETERNNEAKKRGEQTERVENRLKELQKENSNQKLSAKKEELDRFIGKLKLVKEKKNEIKNLLNIYECLLRKTQESSEASNNRGVQNDIETIKDNFLEVEEVDFDD